MPRPTSREELLRELHASYAKLTAQLDSAGPTVGGLSCIDHWTVKDLLSVRVWWTENVVAWIELGRAGGKPVIPAPGFKWSETPRLNDTIVRAARAEPYRSVRDRLQAAFQRALTLIDSLADRELLDVAVFEWAGKWPIARWLSLNMTRQYTTALTFVRRAVAAQRRSRGPSRPAAS
jgi:hypothetical protein